MTQTVIGQAVTLELRTLLDLAAHVILPRELSQAAAPLASVPVGKLQVGVDLGTAYLVLVVLNEEGTPVAGEWQFAQVVRDGLVVDYLGATDLLRGMKARVERRIGREITQASSGYPPGVPRVEVRATAHVIEAAGIECLGLIDEPSAANQVLRIQNGAIVDVGGGTTGVAIVRDGEVVYTADEATGGTHFSLVIAGSLGISFEEAEALKIKPEEQVRLYPLIRPVMEKVGSIVLRHTAENPVDHITLVGGTSAFRNMAATITEYTSIAASVPPHPMFVTPLGMAQYAGSLL